MRLYKKIICSTLMIGTLLGSVSAFAMSDWQLQSGMSKGINFYNQGLYYEARDEFQWFWNANQHNFTSDQRQFVYGYLENAKAGIYAWENRVTNKQKFTNRLNTIMKNIDYRWNNSYSQYQLNSAAIYAFEQHDALLNDVYQHLRTTLPDWEFNNLQQNEIWWIGYKEEKARNDASYVYGGSMYTMEYYSSLAESTKERNYYLISLVRD